MSLALLQSYLHTHKADQYGSLVWCLTKPILNLTGNFALWSGHVNYVGRCNQPPTNQEPSQWLPLLYGIPSWNPGEIFPRFQTWHKSELFKGTFGTDGEILKQVCFSICMDVWYLSSYIDFNLSKLPWVHLEKGRIKNLIVITSYIAVSITN